MSGLFAVEVSPDAWNGNAVSVATMPLDGEYSFRVGLCAGIAAGLSVAPSLGDPTRCTHGFFFEGARVSVIERGVIRSLADPWHAESDVFSIRRVGGLVTYRRNGAIVYTGATASTGEVLLDAALYGDGDAILDLTFVSLSDAAVGAARFPRAVSRARDSSAAAMGLFPALTGSAEARTVDRGSAAFPALRAFAGTAASLGRAAFPALRAAGDDLPIPRFDRGRGFLPAAAAYGTDRNPGTGSASGPLPALAGFATDQTAVGRGRFPALVVSARARVTAEVLFYGNLPGLVGASAPDGTVLWSTARLGVPAPELHARALPGGAAAVRLRVPTPALRAAGGATARLAAPVPTLALRATQPAYARASLSVPAPPLSVSATDDPSAVVALSLPAPTLSAWAGGRCGLSVPAPVLRAAADAADTAALALSIPAPALRAVAQPAVLLILRLSVPPPALSAGSSIARLSVPPPVLRAVVTAQDDTQVTWVVNVETGAVTRFAVGDIVKWAAHDGVLYGLRHDGALLRFNADTDAGVLVHAAVRFAPQQFGTYAVKRLDTVYFDAVETGGLTMELVADETEAQRYYSRTDRSAEGGTYKISPGRGVRFHSVGLTLRDRDGGRFEVGGIEPLVYAHERRPK